jgi:hypothetical protein
VQVVADVAVSVPKNFHLHHADLAEAVPQPLAK